MAASLFLATSINIPFFRWGWFSLSFGFFLCGNCILTWILTDLYTAWSQAKRKLSENPIDQQSNAELTLGFVARIEMFIQDANLGLANSTLEPEFRETMEDPKLSTLILLKTTSRRDRMEILGDIHEEFWQPFLTQYGSKKAAKKYWSMVRTTIGVRLLGRLGMFLLGILGVIANLKSLIGK